MATQKKGCGFLITALILLLLGGGIAGFLGYSTYREGVNFTEQIKQGTVFITPASGKLTAEDNSAITVWVDSSLAKNKQNIKISVIDDKDGKTIPVETATKTNADGTITSSNNTTIGNQTFIAAFKTKKGASYTINAQGLPDGSTVKLTNVDPKKMLGLLGKGAGALIGGGIFFFLAFIFGIIGIIRFFTSNKQLPPAPSQTPPTPPTGF